MRSKKRITYHGRSGYPEIHRTAKGRKYIMVRAEDGKGVKRLYEGSLYHEEPTRKKGKKTMKRLKL